MINSTGKRRMNKRLLMWGGLSGTMETVWINTRLDTQEKYEDSSQWLAFVTKLKDGINSQASGVPWDTDQIPSTDRKIWLFQIWCPILPWKCVFMSEMELFPHQQRNEGGKMKNSNGVRFAALLLGSRPPLRQAFSTPCGTQARPSQRQTKQLCYILSVWKAIIILLYTFQGFHPTDLRHTQNNPPCTERPLSFWSAFLDEMQLHIHTQMGNSEEENNNSAAPSGTFCCK